MRRLKSKLWKASITIAVGMFFLMLMVQIPVEASTTHAGTSASTMPGTIIVQATPTEDATVTALTKEHLVQEVADQQHTWNNWLWSNAAMILSSFLSTLVIVIGALVGLWRWRRDHHSEMEKRAEERFQAAVTGLGDDKEGARVGAAILLRTFLRPGYKQFYTQTFDLAVAHLRLPRTSSPLPQNDPDPLHASPQVDPDTPPPLTTLSQALIVVFKEAFPLARDRLKEQDPKTQFHPQSLDASHIQLDRAYLRGADLKQMWMPWASLRKANLFRADLSEARLKWADLSGAILLDALSLKGTDLRGVKGLTKEQLETCKAKGAIIDEESTTDSSQSTISLPPSPRNDMDASLALSAQGSTQVSDAGESSTPSSKLSAES